MRAQVAMAFCALPCALAIACSDPPVAPEGAPHARDPQASAVLTLLADPWMADLVDGIAEPTLRRPFADFSGDVEGLFAKLERARQLELGPGDLIAADILELSLLAAEPVTPNAPPNAEATP